MATALATKSPDLGIRAVFFAALADGSVAQVHVEKGVDDLVPPGAFTPIPDVGPESVESSHPRVVTRVGMIFNWVPTRILFVTDPLANRILALDINQEDTDPQALFTATNPRYLTSRHFDEPIDIAPTAPEVAARNFASNTTLGGGSDLYVLNRGNNTIVRMEQNGTVTAVRHIQARIPGFRAQGLAVSEDARLIWVTATAPRRQGVVLQMPTFGAGRVTTSMVDHAREVGANGAVAQGLDVFVNDLGPEQGLGPLFNGRSCDNCHHDVAGTPFPGGMGVSLDTFVIRVAHIENGIFDPLLGRGGPIARQRSITEFGIPCDLPTGIPPEANATSRRSAMTLRGTSLLDNIRVADLEGVRMLQPLSVQGRLNRLADGRVGRFGWKAQTASLVEFMGEAFRDEIGETNPLAPRDLVRGCGTTRTPKADAVPLTALVAFLNTIDPPVPSAGCLASPGAALFAEQAQRGIGCATCHRPTMFGPGNSGANPTTIRPYTDLLLHDMGPGLADGFLQGSANGNEFRTAPLWRVSDRVPLLHDGRAGSLREAIEAHGGRAASAVGRFHALTPTEQQDLLDFLNCI